MQRYARLSYKGLSFCREKQVGNDGESFGLEPEGWVQHDFRQAIELL